MVNTQEFASAHLSHIIATYILCGMECTSTVLVQIFRSYCCSCILIRFGKIYMYLYMLKCIKMFCIANNTVRQLMQYKIIIYCVIQTKFDFVFAISKTLISLRTVL